MVWMWTMFFFYIVGVVHVGLLSDLGSTCFVYASYFAPFELLPMYHVLRGRLAACAAVAVCYHVRDFSSSVALGIATMCCLAWSAHSCVLSEIANLALAPTLQIAVTGGTYQVPTLCCWESVYCVPQVPPRGLERYPLYRVRRAQTV